MATPGSESRRMVRPTWAPATADSDEGLANLRERLIAYSKMMFWSFVALLTYLATIYALFPGLAPAYNSIIFGSSAVLLAAMAVIWRGVLVRRSDLTLSTLHTIDLVYAIGIGTSFAGAALLSPDLKASHYTSVIFACFTVFTRALVVPSSGPRTTFVSAMAFVPIVIASCIMPFETKVELGPFAFITGCVLIASVTVLLATTGARIIYGLRQQVSEANRLGIYTLVRKITEGGMGSVHEGRHLLLRRRTAIKLLLPDRNRPEDLDRFEREVQEMSKLTHPNTVSVFDYGRDGETVYYVMEYLGDGIDLERLVKQFGPLDSPRVAHVLAQVCGALQEAHEHGLIHRDVKPGNIMLCERGGLPDVAKVIDYGLVKNFTADDGKSGQVIQGTAHYIAPEAATAPLAVGPPADIYALGAVGYWVLTGQRMFSGKTSVDVYMQHVTKPVVPPSEAAPEANIDPRLEALILRCVSKAPGDRPTTAALGAELRVLAREWGEDDARRWWADYRVAAATQVGTTTDTPTQTITVDVAHRRS
jgi:serine/threonine-protein kinase